MEKTSDFLKLMALTKADALPEDCFEKIMTRQLDAMVVEGIFNKAECEKIVNLLEENSIGFEITEFPAPFKSIFYGRNLNLNEPDLEDYFDAAQQFHEKLKLLEKASDVPILKRLQAMMSELNANQVVSAAPGPSDYVHYFTTFRKHSPGGYIPAHFDNEQRLRPTYRYISNVTKGDIFSFVVTLSEAQSGGVLEIYDLTSDDARYMRNQDGSKKPDLSYVKKQQLHVPTGSMAIVNSGRRLHRVVPVEGSANRWTMCSFMAQAHDSNNVYCWG